MCYMVEVMSKMITLREANHAFSRCVREVEAGEEITITRMGKPVARLVLVAGRRVLTPEQEAARARALERMKKGWPMGAGPLNRDELNDEILWIHDPKRR
jgi:prevent-host-death family protein